MRPPAIRFWYRDPIVKEWEGFFLRDDCDDRVGQSWAVGCEEAYSLFRVVDGLPYREHVFAGSFDWAIRESEKLIESIRQSN